MPMHPGEPRPPASGHPDPPSEGVEPSSAGSPPRSGPQLDPGPVTGESGPDATGGPAAPSEQEMQELQDRWRRALADLDNQRKRHARELERERATERSRTAAAFLPVLDNLELALTHAGSDAGAIVEGVRAVRDQAVNVLELLGYPRHAETGIAFDPARHEVVGVVEDPDASPGTIVEVLRPGYGDGERQLRPASVTVAKRE